MTLPIYQVDAFVGNGLLGNPAAVVPLDEWLDDRTMLRIAEENNLSETAFFVKEGEHFRLRWFTPSLEVNLCGHATLAAAYVLFNELGYKGKEISFMTKSGLLTVQKDGDVLSMNFPADDPLPCEPPQGLKEALGLSFKECLQGRYLVALYRREEEIKSITPDFHLMKKMNINVCVTAKGDNCDFVSRFFAPASGINEDPVTGSAHSILIPFWSKRLEKHKLTAKQISPRGGLIEGIYAGDRVVMSGRGKLFLKGEIYL